MGWEQSPIVLYPIDLVFWFVWFKARRIPMMYFFCKWMHVECCMWITSHTTTLLISFFLTLIRVKVSIWCQLFCSWWVLRMCHAVSSKMDRELGNITPQWLSLVVLYSVQASYDPLSVHFSCQYWHFFVYFLVPVSSQTMPSYLTKKERSWNFFDDSAVVSSEQWQQIS
jgi:hypothetical protein